MEQPNQQAAQAAMEKRVAPKGSIQKTSAAKKSTNRNPTAKKASKGWRPVKGVNPLVPSQICQLPACIINKPIDKTKDLFNQIPKDIYEKIMGHIYEDSVSFAVYSLTCRAAHQFWKKMVPQQMRKISLLARTNDIYGNTFSLQCLLQTWMGESMQYIWYMDKFVSSERAQELWEDYQERESAAYMRGEERKERRWNRKRRRDERKKKRANARYWGGDIPDHYDEEDMCDPISEDSDSGLDDVRGKPVLYKGGRKLR